MILLSLAHSWHEIHRMMALAQHRSHWTLRLLVVVLFLGMTMGCGLFGDRRDKSEERIERSQAPLPTSVARKPAKHQHRLAQFLFYSDFPLELSDPLFRELEELPEKIQQTLQIATSDQIIQIYLFEDQLAYEAYIQARDPKLPKRPAFFFSESRGPGMPDELIVVTYMSKRLRTDLRHELTHALLHGVFKTVPLWLDEGLAGYFEQAPANQGVNINHLNALKVEGFYPNLPRLEKLTQIDQMERPEYQESWAWVHWMLHGNAKATQVLLTYLKTLRTSSNPGSLHAKLLGSISDPHQAMVEHIAKLSSPAKKK